MNRAIDSAYNLKQNSHETVVCSVALKVHEFKTPKSIQPYSAPTTYPVSAIYYDVIWRIFFTIFFFQLLHALQRKKTMFEHVNYDWHMSHDDGSTDFSDDETLDCDHPRSNGQRTPEKNGLSPSESKTRTPTGLSVFHSPNNSNNNNSPNKEFFANTSDWSRSTPSDQGADSPGSYRIMPPPPPPQTSKKPSLCKWIS